MKVKIFIHREVEIADEMFEVDPQANEPNYPSFWSKLCVNEENEEKLKKEFPGIVGIEEVETGKVIIEF